MTAVMLAGVMHGFLPYYTCLRFKRDWDGLRSRTMGAFALTGCRRVSRRVDYGIDRQNLSGLPCRNRLLLVEPPEDAFPSRCKHHDFAEAHHIIHSLATGTVHCVWQDLFHLVVDISTVGETRTVRPLLLQKRETGTQPRR